MPKTKNGYFTNKVTVAQQIIMPNELKQGMTQEEANWEMKDNTDQVKVNVYYAVFLEDDTVQALQFKKLGLFSVLETQDRRNKFDLLKIHNKSDAIRLGVFSCFKAMFIVQNTLGEAGDNSFKKNISFTIPTYRSNVSDIENLFTSLNVFDYDGQKLKYLRGTIREVRGKKTAI